MAADKVDGEQFERLVDIIFKMTDIQSIDQLLKILLEGALELVNATHGSIYRLDYQDGTIKFLDSIPASNLSKNISWGQGIMGIALKDKEVIVVPDILSHKWEGIYIKEWENMRSEIAIPIILKNVPIRVKSEIEAERSKIDNTGTKRIGVLSIESEAVDAFSSRDKDLLEHLARYAAIRIEKIESDKKLEKLRKKEQEISESNKDYNQIIDLVVESIITILKFDIVNISLVDLEKGEIETKYIKGVPPEQERDFISRAKHSLTSKDIQADIVRNKKIEVPESDDPRLDSDLAKDFNHEQFVRVFIPMIEPTNDLAIGTVECGYKKEYREFIYERDVQILESFVDRAVQALEKRKKGSLEIITHELRNATMGIKNHADRILNHWKYGISKDDVNARITNSLNRFTTGNINIETEDIKSIVEARLSRNMEDESSIKAKILGYLSGLEESEIQKKLEIVEDIVEETIKARRSYLRDDVIKAKLDDIITDSAILFYQFRQLEFIIGTSKSPDLRHQEVSIRNEIIKVFQQLKPELRSRGFSSDEIDYRFDDKKIKIFTDKARLNQIIYNLLLNSIKYAEKDPNKFRISVKIENKPNQLRIRFQDYGIGIKDDEKESIFQFGFRSEEIKYKVQGSGIGLHISKDLANRLGGELLLINLKNPTEFQLVIPYSINYDVASRSKLKRG